MKDSQPTRNTPASPSPDDVDPWRHLVETHPDALHISVNGIIRYVNPAGVDLYGASAAEEIVGRPLTDFAVTDGEQETMNRRAASVYDAGRPTPPREHAIRTLDGGKRIVESRSVPITYEGQQAAQTIVRDRTHRHELTDQLHETRMQLRQLMKNAQPIIFVIDRGGTFLMSEGKDLGLIGLAPGEVVGESVYELYADKPDVLGAVDEALEGETAHALVEYGEITFDVWYAPIYSRDGQIDGCIGMAVDVTEKRQAASRTKDRQEKLRELYNATNKLLKADDFETLGACVLKLVDETMGYPASAIRLVQDGKLVAVSVTPRTLEIIGRDRPDYDVDGSSLPAQALRSGATQIYEDVRDTDGQDRGGVRGAAYVPIGSLGLISIGSLEVGGIDAYDVQLLEILAGHVESLVQRLTYEEELEAAREEAEAASRLKSSMLANMSHEVRTPLTTLVGFSEVIVEETTEPNIRHFGRLILKGAHRLRDTLESVLQLSRLESEKARVDVTDVCLHEEAAEMKEEQHYEADLKGITLTVETIGPKDACVASDRTSIQRILRNLVGNGIKFTPRGGSVQIRTSAGENVAWLEVEDTGCGMSEAFQARMFDTFTQESEGRQRQHEGSGLGLSIVRKLTVLLGGSIEVESTRGQGTRIAVFLPSAQTGPDVEAGDS